MARAEMALGGVLGAFALAGAVALATGCDSFADSPGDDAGAQETSTPDAAGDGEAAAATAYEAAVLADHPLVFWRLAAKSTTQPDRGTAQLTATITTDVRTDQPSLIGDPSDKSVHLVPDDKITSASTPDWVAGKNAYSMECWVRVTKTANQSDIFFRGTATNGVGIAFDSSGKLKVTRADNGIATSLGSGLPPVTIDASHHVVVTFDGAALTLFFDGKAAESAASNALLKAADLPITIGTTSAAPPSRLDAFVDEVAFYDHALAVDRVVAHAKAGGAFIQ